MMRKELEMDGSLSILAERSRIELLCVDRGDRTNSQRFVGSRRSESR